ncbi:hypothetical protein P154DRAFT_520511 [Amniculicola lignicola CBS 123094]|uniref:Uncharacterized protein n=1 Tax=Amniculicola lignicola CBS 123094 TaxID=1392246 RepID=A0A6A5WNP4_9PLEO|nr:hypothetical protein P154DRAFT_520511 [Amniculicola lignicola CBS 123094]
MGTVIAYAITAGLLIVFIGTGKLIATLWPSIETSEFPMIDYEVLTQVVSDDSRYKVSLRQAFDGKEYGEGAILGEVGDLRIGLRRGYVV